MTRCSTQWPMASPEFRASNRCRLRCAPLRPWSRTSLRTSKTSRGKSRSVHNPDHRRRGPLRRVESWRCRHAVVDGRRLFAGWELADGSALQAPGGTDGAVRLGDAPVMHTDGNSSLARRHRFRLRQRATAMLHATAASIRRSRFYYLDRLLARNHSDRPCVNTKCETATIG